MMKPYFALFRNAYPRSVTFFFFAHWWHPAIYEATAVGVLSGVRDWLTAALGAGAGATDEGAVLVRVTGGLQWFAF